MRCFALPSFAGGVLFLLLLALALAPALAGCGAPAAQGAGAAAAPSDAVSCRRVSHAGAAFAVCEVDPARLEANGQRLALARLMPDGTVAGSFERLEQMAGPLSFAMNAGMYHPDRSPVGLYIEEGGERSALVRGDGPGNFQLLPNGVFWLDGSRAGVTETEAFAALREGGLAPDFATQSGPMLVIDGELHPAINPNGTSAKRRNGVGVGEDGRIHFAISDGFVTFHQFATLFRDGLDTPNALFLDGQISRLHAPALGVSEPGLPLGPIVYATAPEGAR